VAGGPCRTYLDIGTDLKACSRRATTLSLLDELLGDLGLALRQASPSGPYIRVTGSPRSSRARITAITWRLAVTCTRYFPE
jgi:hypothetical protein